MTSPHTSADAARAIRDFLAVYDRHDLDDREVATHIRERFLREMYRREREHYPEWIDVGGEG
jgi:hypothetical protein